MRSLSLLAAVPPVWNTMRPGMLLDAGVPSTSTLICAPTVVKSLPSAAVKISDPIWSLF